MSKTNTSPREHDEQVALFAWAALYSSQHPEITLMHAIPNGGKRDLIAAARLKAEGVKPGVPDICLPVPRGDKHGMYIELKRRKGGHATLGQMTWLDALARQGYHCMLCYGWEHARDEIIRYMEQSTQ